MKEQNIQKSKGITLIALVITIIFLLILSGVTIAMLTGDNGILIQASKAKEQIEKSQELEQIQLAVISLMSNNIELNKSNLQNTLRGAGLKGELNGKGDWIYLGEKSNYIITIDGEVSFTEQKYAGIISGNTQNILPEGYQRVEYVGNTEKLYIDTGIVINNKSAIKSTFQLNGESSDINWFCQNEKILSYKRSFAFGSYYGKFAYNFPTPQYLKVNSDNNKHSIILDAKNTMVNFDGVKNTTGNEALMDTKNFKLFGNYAKNVRFFSFFIFNDGELIRSFIPCLNKDKIPCMYDTVTQETFYSQGDTELIYGESLDNTLSVGSEIYNGKYTIPIHLVCEEDKDIEITINEPLRKLNGIADYIDLSNKKLIRNIRKNIETGELLEITSPLEENIEMEDIDLSRVRSISIGTEVQPTSIE